MLKWIFKTPKPFFSLCDYRFIELTLFYKNPFDVEDQTMYEFDKRLFFRENEFKTTILGFTLINLCIIYAHGGTPICY